MDDKTLFEMLEILITHARRYPQMQPTDAVKLLYQNEFGGGHLVKDPAWSLVYIRKEYAETPHENNHIFIEPIGNGMARVHFQALDENILPLETLNSIFVESSKAHTGSIENFVEKLEILTGHFEEIPFCFSKEDLLTYLKEYAKQDYPMVSHSAAFHEAYAPAYRVVIENLIV